LTAQDLSEAGRIIRLAFGTFLGAPEPEQFWADLDYAYTRWHADPTAAFGAELDGELVGSNFTTRWGSVGLFGPVSVRPDLWDQDIGQRLMEPLLSETRRACYILCFGNTRSLKEAQSRGSS